MVVVTVDNASRGMRQNHISGGDVNTLLASHVRSTIQTLFGTPSPASFGNPLTWNTHGRMTLKWR